MSERPVPDAVSEPGDAEAWPGLPLDPWKDTYATLHLWMQIVGKTRLELAPMQNHWWQAALYVTTRGLETSPMPYGWRTLNLEFDFRDHVLVARTSDGAAAGMRLEPCTVAAFYERYLAMTGSLGAPIRIHPVPSEIADPIPFYEDRIHASYDPEAAQRFWRVLVQVDRVFKEFRGRFLGKSSPVHFWWGSFDLACTRFSGRRAPTHPGGIPNMPDAVTQEAYSHECISAGWWPGFAEGPIAEAAFYAYAYPEPPGCPEAPVRPGGATYNATFREWIYPYAALLQEPDKDAALLDFLESTYEAAAELGGWERASLERNPRRLRPATP